MIQPTLNFGDLNRVDVVIEAVFENMDVKKKVFTKLIENCKPSCVLATNTSALDIDEICDFVASIAPGRETKVIGTHFFAPANQMKLVENVQTKSSDEVSIATVQNMGKMIGKIPVLVRNCFGFVVKTLHK